MLKQHYDLHHKNVSPNSLVKLCLLSDKQEFHNINADSYKNFVTKKTNDVNVDPLSGYDFMLEIKFDDFIGAEIIGSEIIFHTTAFPSGGCSTPETKLRKMFSHHFLGDDSKLVEIRDSVLESFSNFCKKEYDSGKIEHENNVFDSNALKSYEKRILVLINPVGGDGNAVKGYEKIERYILSSGFVPTVIKTTHFLHAHDLIRHMEKEELIKYYAVVTVSGDGVAHEIVNGFYERPDHKEFTLRMAFQHGGSACGLACSATKEWKLGHDQTNCLYVLARGRFKSISITKYDINDEKNQTVYGLCGYLFGFTSDIDFDSEFLRWFGGARLQMYAAANILNPNKRLCNIWLSKDTIPNDMSIDSQINTENMTWKSFEGPTYNFMYQTSPVLASDVSLTNKLGFGDEYACTQISLSKNGQIHFVKEILSCENFTIDEYNDCDIFKIKSFRLELVEKNGFNNKNTLINIDGEKYWGTKVQGTVLQDRRTFVIC